MNCICIENNNWVEILVMIIAVFSLAVSLNAFRLQKITYIDNALYELAKNINSNKGKDLSYLVTDCILAKQILEIHVKDEFNSALYCKQDIVDKFYLSIDVSWKAKIKNVLTGIEPFPDNSTVKTQLEDSVTFLYFSIVKYNHEFKVEIDKLLKSSKKLPNIH